MAMFMYIYRIFVSLLLLLVHCEVTVEQATKGPLSYICTTTWRDTNIKEIPPLAEEDEDVINELLGCSWGILPLSCSIGSNAVTCDCYPENHKRCRVVHIDFSNKRLEGRIPEKIGDLKYLRTLYLNGNKLRGSIPDSFQYLERLSDFSLCDNSLDGRIPPFIGQMKYLRLIYLCKNFFDETIPPEFGYLRRLEYLDLSNNFLWGNIPSQLGDITSLIGLYLAGNQLSDKLPDHLGNLVNLEELHLYNNEFIGPLPPSFKNLNKLTYFNVRGNNLNDTIPDIFNEWQDLRIMNLMGNNFSAPLRGQFSKLKSLTTLYISDLVGGNSSFPDLSEVKFLSALTLRNCSINASIPDWIWKLSGLQYLDLSFNHLYGGIPASVPEAVDQNSLEYLFLRKNELNETIPAWMNATEFVDLSENHFKNVSISPGKAINPNLNLFKCCSNETEEVAKRDQVDFHCKNGTQLYDHLFINCGGESVSVNGSEYEADVHQRGESTFFKSNSSKWGYSSMGSFLWANRNKYLLNDTCQIHAGDAQLYRTARLSPISLKYYGFCLKTGMYQVNLHFADISSSTNAVSHSKAGRLFNVDIQGENVLSNFNIEKVAKRMDKATTTEHTAYVQNNLLEIHLYWSGKGSSLYPSVYYGPLISAITVTPVQSQLSTGVLVGISAFALLSLILFIGFSWSYQDKLRREELELVELYPGGLYNYRKIKAATNNFDDANRLGEGGFGTVYKGTLSNGTAVAVKQLSATKDGMTEFVEKSRTIAGVKHSNLVTLMGFCAGKNQLLLIYEYIGTISLEDALFGSEELRARLDWATRYRICLGLAEGLSFLHEGSKHEIIHGDIKPANILLDDDLNPKIYDFGFAKLYHKQKLEVTTSYTAPEVKDRPLEANADVYNFGVVTLILVSGKNITTPRAGGEIEYLTEEAQIKNRGGNLMELVDQSLNYDWEEADMILRLAMQCIDSPPFRPTMSTVVKILKKELSIEELELVELYPGGLYNYLKIKSATNNFDAANRLGEGGFGTVYKGTLSNGTAVAVKKLSATKDGISEFVEKSRTIAGVKHSNLVTLMGCCPGKNQLLLIYEYIGTVSLEDALFGSEELRARLDWATRYRICLGLAEGLSFLHEGSKHEIIHGDIKPANILLDDDLNPKIYDFGFAKLYHKQKLEVTTSYTAPEVKDRPLEANADVYNFGVVTLILVSGKNITTPTDGEIEYLVEEAQIKNRRGNLMELVDQSLNYDWEEADMILRLAMQCIDDPPFRPTMSTIVKILKKERSIETIMIKPEGD